MYNIAMQTARKIFFYLSLVSIFPILAQDFNAANLRALSSLTPELQKQFLSSTNEVSAPNLAYNTNEPEIENEDDEDLLPYEEEKFGFSFFRNSSNSQLNTQVGSLISQDYSFDVGDQIEISITGSFSANYSLNIKLDGSILIPSVGSIQLAGLDFDTGTERINQYVSRKYSGTESSVSIQRVSSKSISVIGAVERPGNYIVNGFADLVTAIRSAGRLNENASLRSIEIVSNDNTTKKIDLYSFLVFGLKNGNPFLKSGDVVNVKATSNFIKVDGDVERPLIYEYKANDSVIELINFAQGFKNSAVKEKTFVNYIDDGKLITKPLENDYLLLDDTRYESIFIPSIQFSKDIDAFVSGDGVSNGFYNYKEGESVSNLLSRLVFTNQIYPYYFRLKQQSANGFVQEVHNLSLADRESYDQIKLKENINLTFYGKSDIDDIREYYEKLQDSEKNLNLDIEQSDLNRKGQSGYLTGNSKENEDTIEEEVNFDQLESFEKPEILRDIEDSNLIKIYVGDTMFEMPIAGKFNPTVFLQYFELDGDFNAENISFNGEIVNDLVEFKAESAIYLPEIKLDKVIVEIIGQVAFPGKYIVDRNTSLNSLYKIAGGILPTANVEGIFFSRNEIRKREFQAYNSAREIIESAYIGSLVGSNSSSVNPALLNLLSNASVKDFPGRLSGNFAPNSNSTRTLILEDGDKVVVPNQSLSVTVTGEVLSPTTFLHEDRLSLESYFDLAGGLTRDADKRNVYIIRVNGNSVPVSTARLGMGSVKILPGDTIVVPKNLNKTQLVPLISVATQVISDITLAAASLNAISN